MQRNSFLKLIIITFFFVVAFVFLPTKAVFASSTDGTITGYAWSSQIGWVNFGTVGGNSQITDTAVTGYAWNENMGWINLGATGSGVKNDSNGNLSGKAWSEGTGWIDFTGVTVNNSGLFIGTATGDNNVSINFNCTKCDVTTDWRPLSSRTPSSPSSGGGGGGTSGSAFPPPSAPFSISINNGSQYTNTQNVTLYLTAQADAVKMEISNTPDFDNAVLENYQATIPWQLISPDGTKTVYVKFYTDHNVPSNPISSSIILDTTAPTIKITSIQNTYNSNQDVVISGSTESNAKVNMVVDNSYGTFNADAQGNWFITLGKMSVGQHHIEFTAQDLAGNVSNPVDANFSVTSVNQPQVPPLPSFMLGQPLAPILRQLEQGITALLPKFLQPIAKNVPTPTAVAIVPLSTPVALNGSFHYISPQTLAVFVLAPLPTNIALLAEKFPQLQNTFAQVGINKFTDVPKLASANLTLPNLSQTLFPQVQLTSQNLATIQGIPVEKLSPLDKSRIPSEVVFAKGAGGLVDFDAALSLDSQGEPEQTIETVAQQPLQLVVRADQPVKSVIGYVVFKSKTYNNQTSYKMPLSNLTASLLFANPVLTTTVPPSTSISVDGNPNNDSSFQENVLPQVLDTQDADNSSNSGSQQRLVLSTFQYQDTGNGVYTATIDAPAVDANYQIITQLNYQDPTLAPKEIILTAVVDPQGYVYQQNGNLQSRIPGAVVSLYWLNSATQQYELWPATNFQQENPQTTNVAGSYSFLVPNGFYYIKVDAPGYISYSGKPFEITQGSGIHTNIELTPVNWWLTFFDWKTILLILVVLLLLYNFYKDKMRERRM